MPQPLRKCAVHTDLREDTTRIPMKTGGRIANVCERPSDLKASFVKSQVRWAMNAQVSHPETAGALCTVTLAGLRLSLTRILGLYR